MVVMERRRTEDEMNYKDMKPPPTAYSARWVVLRMGWENSDEVTVTVRDEKCTAWTPDGDVRGPCTVMYRMDKSGCVTAEVVRT
jgi:hypothetical protein